MEFKLGELFCGPGGLALGAKSAALKHKNREFNIKPVWANDYDEDTCATYRENICHDNTEQVICCDVKKLDFKKLPEIDALAFGFPCNDYSIVGEQKGMDGLYGPLYSYGIKVLKLFQPKWFLAENVGGLRNANDGKAFEKILEELFTTGYNITPHLYKFEYYGVPQARHRLIIIGIRKDIGMIYNVPKPTTPKTVSCRYAIETPPIPSDADNHILTKQAPQVVERLKHINPGENAFTADLPEHLKLKVKGAKISQIYRRLNPAKPAYTVTGSGGGGTHVYHWTENRALTNRERARLQTFPDNFVFCGSKESVRKQIGMAVPPQGAKVIFQAILKTFAGIKYHCLEPSITPLIHGKNYLVDYTGLGSCQIRLFEQQQEYAV
jgi:DNA (cytosine-5)-methyltransferase 1